MEIEGDISFDDDGIVVSLDEKVCSLAGVAGFCRFFIVYLSFMASANCFRRCDFSCISVSMSLCNWAIFSWFYVIIFVILLIYSSKLLVAMFVHAKKDLLKHP